MKTEVKRFEELSAAELYELLRLRVDVFVVEQRCPYPDLDGRDEGALHVLLWGDGGGLDAYLRILRPDEDTEDELEYYRSKMTAYALYGLVNAWILRGYRETPAEMERIVRDWIAASREAQGKA